MSQLAIQPDAASGVDAYITDAVPTGNFGTAETLLVGTNVIGSAFNMRSLLRFDVSGVPLGTAILQATLHLQITSSILASDDAFTAYRLTQTGWTEDGVTWEKYDGSNNWSTAGGDYSLVGAAACVLQEPGDVHFDVTALVLDAIANRGGILNLLIKGSESGSTQFMEVSSSDEPTALIRPLLTIDYSAQGSRPFMLPAMLATDDVQAEATVTAVAWDVEELQVYTPGLVVAGGMVAQ
ncbi:MAG: DNRLRE domain-containing protein [Pirellulales bacterium]